MGLYQKGSFAEAYKRFEMAEALHHAPTLVLFMAHCKRDAGELLAAKALYERVANENLGADAEPQFKKAQAEATEELSALATRIPAVQIRVKGPTADATVRVDGEALAKDALREPLLLEPGTHRVELMRGGRPQMEKVVDLKDGGGVTEVVFDVDAAASSSTQTEGPAGGDEGGDGGGGSLVPAGICFGVAGAGLVVGIATGVLALTKDSDLKARCVDNHCPVEDAPKADEVGVLATVSTVGFVVAGVAAAAGVVLAIVQPGGGDDEAAISEAQLRLGPGSVGFDFRF